MEHWYYVWTVSGWKPLTLTLLSLSSLWGEGPTDDVGWDMDVIEEGELDGDLMDTVCGEIRDK